jgi:hypothetical protein
MKIIIGCGELAGVVVFGPDFGLFEPQERVREIFVAGGVLDAQLYASVQKKINVRMVGGEVLEIVDVGFEVGRN